MSNGINELYSMDAEKAVLGSILIDPDYALSEVASKLSKIDFYQSRHQIIFDVFIDCFKKKIPVDVLTVKEKLEQKGFLDKVGGASYLSLLSTGIPSSTNVSYYAKIILDHSKLRQLLNLSNELASKVKSYEGEPDDVLDFAQQEINRISLEGALEEALDYKDIFKESLNWIEQKLENKNLVSGISSGFKNLDRITNGFQKGKLIILAGRPAMGKTSLALNMAYHMSFKEDKVGLFFSLEMSSDELSHRLISAEGRVDSVNLRTGFLRPSDWKKLLSFGSQLQDKKLFLSDAAHLSYLDVRSTARRLKNRLGKLDYIMIDYIQLMKLPYGRREDRRITVGEISRELKLISKELGVPIIILSQLSRKVEERQEKRPMISDLKESGDLEQDADLIMFVYRPGYYFPDIEEYNNLAEILVSKHRSGPTGTAKLVFLEKYTRFEDMAIDFSQ